MLWSLCIPGSSPVKEVGYVLMDTMQIVLSEAALAQSTYLREEKKMDSLCLCNAVNQPHLNTSRRLKVWGIVVFG